MDEKIIKILNQRAWKILETLNPLLEFLPEQFIIGGGSISNKKWNDIDLFAPSFDQFDIKSDSWTRISQTRNATTLRLNDGTIVQLCNYWKDTLEALVDSFDFGMIQSGVLISNKTKVTKGYVKVDSTYYTEHFIHDRVCNTANFVHTEYPLSSLIRCRKYHERGWMTNGEYTKNIINILAALVERGFKTYDDFKDQLDSVDLGLLADEFSDIDKSAATKLFNLLETKAGYVDVSKGRQPLAKEVHLADDAKPDKAEEIAREIEVLFDAYPVASSIQLITGLLRKHGVG